MYTHTYTHAPRRSLYPTPFVLQLDPMVWGLVGVGVGRQISLSYVDVRLRAISTSDFLFWKTTFDPRRRCLGTPLQHLVGGAVYGLHTYINIHMRTMTQTRGRELFFFVLQAGAWRLRAGHTRPAGR